MAGIVLALAAAVAFALANTSASVAYHSGSNALTVAAIRFVLPTATLIVWLRMRGVPFALRGRDGWLAALLGAVTAVYTWALLSAIASIPLALAILVFYLFPLVATVILAACGWEKFGWQTITAIVLASGSRSHSTQMAATSILRAWRWLWSVRSVSALSLQSLAASSAPVMHVL